MLFLHLLAPCVDRDADDPVSEIRYGLMNKLHGTSKNFCA